MNDGPKDEYQVRCISPIHLIDYFARLGFDRDDLTEGMSISHEKLFKPDNWIPIADWYRLLDNCCRLAPSLTLYDWEGIGHKIRKSEASRLVRAVVRMFGAQRVIAMSGRHIKRFNNYSSLTVTPHAKGQVEIITWVEPAVEATSHGLFLRWTAGVMSAVVAIDGMESSRIRVIYDQASLKNIVTRLYGRRYRQSGDDILMDDQVCAKRIRLKTDDIYFSQSMAPEYDDQPPFNATLVTRDVVEGDRCLLKKGDIFDAPAGRMILEWKPRSIFMRWIYGVRNLALFSTLSRQELVGQTELAEQRYFEAEGSRLREQAVRISLEKEIEEHKHTSKAKEQLEVRLRQSQKMEAIGALAGGIAHDFNNILFPLVGYTEMLKEDIPDQSPLQESLDEILGGALRAKELVKQILSFSRQTDMELKPLRVQPILKEVIQLIKASLPATIDIIQFIDPDCGAIQADPTQIHQIAMNLVTNAFHSMQERGGQLKVMLEERQIQGGAAEKRLPPGRYACLTVTDTGIGMDGTTLERIFDPYFSTKEMGKGTGLGLSVVHGIVKNCGGEILVHSQMGQGSQFEIYLPRLVTNTNETAPHLHALKAATGNERILLVDDEAPIARMLERMLSRLGYAVTVRYSSVDALEAFHSDPKRFDLVLTDLTMPNMTGDHLASEIKRIQPTIPVILCTGFSEKLGSQEARIPDVDQVLLKPIIRDDLAHVVRRALDTAARQSTPTGRLSVME